MAIVSQSRFWRPIQSRDEYGATAIDPCHAFLEFALREPAVIVQRRLSKISYGLDDNQ